MDEGRNTQRQQRGDEDERRMKTTDCHDRQLCTRFLPIALHWPNWRGAASRLPLCP
jgi:hypothetical protein